MNTQLLRQKEIFLAVLEHAPSEQAEVLEVMCAGDAVLRTKIEQLLDAHERGWAAFDRQLVEFGQAAVAQVIPPDERGRDLRLGDYIGLYELLEIVGEGGMGVVYLAQQHQPLRRKVALKIVKSAVDTPGAIARFEAERQTLALMDHPSITRVFDAGTTDRGRPYFIMELVQGKSITEFCDARRLPIAERLQLFMQVCDAVQHAHQKGIIHRDLKPSNVLIALQDEVPVPKVIDFGIAKSIEPSFTKQTLITLGQMIGTADYMSPEQAGSEADIDTRSDIYSLGALLYELLTGTVPLENLRSLRFSEICEAICTHQPERPSARIKFAHPASEQLAAARGCTAKVLHGLLRGDLDWITAKCLAKDRTQRYQTASELVGDLRRHLQGEAIEAGPPSRWYRVRKFVARHRVAVASAAAAIATLLLSAVISLSLALHSYRYAQRARQAESLALSRLAEALEKNQRQKAAESSTSGVPASTLPRQSPGVR